MNLQLDWAVTGHGMSHIISVIDTIVRKEYTTRGLHLNSQGKRKLIHPTAKGIGEDCVPSVNGILLSPMLQPLLS